ncbi:TaqI-like C-terminal specificity domain-containing protein [Flavobacterium sp.]|uniref:Eco57I restriction-modification methylase domain-containing protein n=1 Tax=Flavobacterium sp. TaxID=239 RepID=UPI00260278EC|nr:TaqI-like C-terminal specificity domain-containing protein [Flavobacterium sp.]
MNKDTLIQLFKAPYNRDAFINSGLLPTFQGKVANLKVFDEQGVQKKELTASEQQFAVSVVKYGEFQTLDALSRTVELFEVIVNDDKQIERNRVGLGALIKKHIIGNNAVLVNFAYQNPEKRSWRFSFIARDGVFQDGEMQITDTHPKRYTYVFGEADETYKTALDRFFILGNELEITINKIKDAFGVEAMSKAFFDEYRDVHYAGFVDYLMRSNFKKAAFDGNDKDVRDFVKKLLGRIVFLYFLQKKGWLGAKDTSYKNGDKNFMTNFFKKAGANDAFYANWLSKLFFDALNNERPNDDFTMPDGEIVKIPYLNGGLFENESAKYDFLTFPADLFTNLFAFFDQYNFTIFEDSPEEHTVAVDPEMLGHIFENLLEDNKDKGAFYTPKEIVHYMTQESLIEYLHTQIPAANRNDIEHFVKNKIPTEHSKLSKEHKKLIDDKLDTVKICDPAIGSGAFPMGLLQEIFGLKERIAYDLGYKVWSPATVKENIIQKSIYGVDIERGAVDIARLRFWLSLIVDEEMPKALPNLDYKIVVGNSLVSKFDDTVIEVDWDRKGSVGEADKHIQGVQTALKGISEKQKQFFESKSNKQKAKLKAEIRDLKLDVLINQLSFNKTFYLNKNQKVTDMGFGLKATDHKKNLEIDLQVAEFNQTLTKLQKLKENPDQDFNHFDWKLDFPEVLNPLVNEETGFDIVIGNPPYVSAVTMRRTDEEKQVFKNKYPEISGSYDLYILFLLLVRNISRKQGFYSWIIPNKVLISDYAKQTLNFLKENGLIASLNVSKFNVFRGVGVYPIILKGLNFSDKKDFEELFVDEYTDLAKGKFKKVQELPNYSTIKSEGLKINSGTTGFEAQKIKNLVSEKYDSLKIPFTVSGNIDRYVYNNENVQFMKNRYPFAFIQKVDEIADSKWKFWSKPKIVIAGMTKVIEAVYVPEPLALGVGVYGIYDFNGLDPYALTAILNSKYLSFYFKLKFKDKHLAGGYLAINKSTIEEFPLVKPTKSLENILKCISIIVHFITQKSSNINSEVPNQYLTEAFEEVIDALVFELYFPAEFAEKGIEIEKYAQNIFQPIDGLDEEEKIKAIKEVYLTLREKDNPLRNQIKLMKIELKELLLPILSV